MIDGLFKYFPPDSYKLSKLVERKVLLTPPKYFNDPWDFRTERVPMTDAELIGQFEKFENEKAMSEADGLGLWLPTTFVQQEKKERFKKFKASVTRREYRETEGLYMQTELSDIFGVVPLTHDPLNRLMWAHYADAHRGFVVQFAIGKQLKHAGFEVVITPFGLASKVEYNRVLPKIERTFKNSARVCCTKHETWQHE